MAMQLKKGVTYNKDTNTVGIDRTVADVGTKTVESVIDSNKFNVDVTQQTNKMDTSTGKPQTITTSTGIRNEFDKNSAELNKISPTVTNTTTNSDGSVTTTYSDGTSKTVASPNTPVANSPEPTQPVNPNETETERSLRLINEKRAQELAEQDRIKAESNAAYEKLKADSDEQQKTLLDSINKQYNAIRDSMVDSNNRANAQQNQLQYLVNGFQYTPGQSNGSVQAVENYGIQQLQKIQDQRAAVLLQAQQAKTDKDYEALSKHMQDLANLSKDRLTTLNEMAKGAQDIKASMDTVANMTENQTQMMNGMLASYGTQIADIPDDKKESWYEEKAKEISKSTGATITAAYVKSQMGLYTDQAKKEKLVPDAAQSSMFGYYVNKKGEPILTADGKQIHYSPDDKVTTDTTMGTMTIIGHDVYGNITTKTISLPGYENTGGSYSSSGGSSYTPKTSFESDSLKQSVPVTTTANGIRIEVNNGDKTGQCGAFVNDFMDGTPGWTHVTNSWESKLAMRNSSTPIVGGAVMWNPGGKYSANGHIGIIESVNADGSFDIVDSNYTGNETASHRTIQVGSPEYKLIMTNGGFFDPTKVPGKSTSIAGLSPAQLTQLDNMDGDYYTAAGKATLRNAKISDAQLNAYLSDKANQSSDPQRAEKMMTALMNVQGDITKLPKTRGDAGTFSFREVNDFFASRGQDVSTLKPAMITLGKMAGGTGITAMDHLGMLSRFVNNTATGFTTSDTALKNQIEQWAGATDITNADEMAKLAAQEIGKAYGAGTGGEKEALLDSLNNGTQSQKLSAIKTAAEALMDQYINANSAYYDVTGKDYPEFTKLKEKYNKVGGGTSSTTAPTTSKRDFSSI